MKRTKAFPAMLLAAFWAATAVDATPVGTAFTYQGRLTDAGSPAEGSYDFLVRICDAATEGNVLCSVLSEHTAVQEGLFTLNLDCGDSLFAGEARWLELRVRASSGEEEYTVLSPRQEVAPAPYALFALNGAGGGGLSLPYSGSSDSSVPAFSATNISGSIAIRGLATNAEDVVNYGGYFEAYGSSGRGIAGAVAGSNARGVYGFAGGGGIAGYFENAAGNDAPALQTIGDAVVQGRGWPWGGYDSRLFLGDGNHYIKSVAGQGVRIGTYGVPDGMVLQEVTGNLGIGTTSPTEKLHVAGPARFEFTTGSVYVSTPGGNPGLITFPPNGHRRDIVFDDDGMRLLVGNSDAPPGQGLDIFEDGKVSVKILEITGGSDLAEPFQVAGGEPACRATTQMAGPGMVAVIDPKNPGQLELATQAYDRKVAGVISGANGLKPGMVMKAAGTPQADGEHPIALTGRVWCWCDAGFGPIEPGDRLTTSQTPGHAMKVLERDRADGAVLGKAMTSLQRGTGLVLVLVTLQ